MKKSKPATVEAAPKIKTGKGGQAKQDSAGKPAKDKSPKDKSAKGKTAKDKPAKTPDFDFIGKVESIRVVNGPEQPLFAFGLRGRNGVRRSFHIAATESFALHIMPSIVTAAHAAETKIGVRVGEGDEVVEVQSRPRLGKNG